MAYDETGPTGEVLPTAVRTGSDEDGGCFTNSVPLRITLTQVPGVAVIVRLAGEIDPDQRRALAEVLDSAVARHQPRLVVDIAAVGFCDCTVLNVLLSTCLASQEAGVELVVTGADHQARRLFEITGADRVFTLRTTVSSALAGARESNG
ncbi:STAS domain-containing protein [Kitasatospora sp. NPDC048407]|uniref:STAS domain-containing protein n=1 Tax=Kitasatospora sp. NPDC048407 TaxID=3364051 RepID=UPI00371AF70A